MLEAVPPLTHLLACCGGPNLTLLVLMNLEIMNVRISNAISTPHSPNDRCIVTQCQHNV
jgi:hypothetical protein